MNIFKKSFKLILLIIVFLSFSQTVSAANLSGGNPVISRTYSDSWSNFTLVDTNGPISANGIVNSWSIWAKSLTKVQLKIFRLTGTDYTVVGESELITPNAAGVNTFNLPNPIPVNKGDFVGLYFQEAGGVAFDLDSGGFVSGNLDGTVKFTNPGENPGIGETAHFDDSSNRTYSLSVGGIVQYKVDDDRVECPTADYTKIKDAVADPNILAGETIYVCRGTYTEAVKVNKENLTIVSTDGANVTTVKAATSDSTKFAFFLKKNGITIKGFTIKDADDLAGASGIVLNNNIGGSTINNNIFDHNNYSIYSDKSNSNKITGNVFKNGIKIGGDGVVISLVGSSNEISGNQLQDNDTDGIVLSNSSNNKISSNSISGSGIKLLKSNKNNIISNMINNSLSDGIQLSGTSNQNTIKTNSVSKAKRDGIRAEADTQKNTIQNNMIKNNFEHDVHDLTASKKAKVKNYWIFNMCSTSSPSGLCF